MIDIQLVLDGLDWDRVTEEECGILLEGTDLVTIEQIYNSRRDWSTERLQFQERRHQQRRRWKKGGETSEGFRDECDGRAVEAGLHPC